MVVSEHSDTPFIFVEVESPGCMASRGPGDVELPFSGDEQKRVFF